MIIDSTNLELGTTWALDPSELAARKSERMYHGQKTNKVMVLGEDGWDEGPHLPPYDSDLKPDHPTIQQTAGQPARDISDQVDP